jgi:hypothetical protein
MISSWDQKKFVEITSESAVEYFILQNRKISYGRKFVQTFKYCVEIKEQKNLLYFQNRKLDIRHVPGKTA